MKVVLSAGWVHQFMGELRAQFPQVEFVQGDTPETLMAAIPDAEVVFGPINSAAFAAARKLKWVQSPSAGVEWMRGCPEIIDTNIIVTNARGAHATTIAEHTFGMLTFLSRHFDDLYEAQKLKSWTRPLRAGVGLVGMTMGIIGLGNIGRAIAKRAHAFEMDVIAVDVHSVPRPDYVSEVRLLDAMPDLIRRSDVVVVATPITEQTRGMIGPDLLNSMKPSAYLLVVSRGGIIHEPTLVKMLHEGRLAGAGLDVTEVEPLPADNALWTCPNIIITPHCSPSSEQTIGNVTNIIKENLRRFVAGEQLTNIVDKKLGY